VRILVVDDEPPIMALCLKILARLGHQVEGVTSGDEALKKLAVAPVDLLVVDYKMPGLNGFEVVRRARAILPALKVVLITGHGTREVMGEALDGGVNGILVKPFTPDELTQTISAAIE
jgi:CheY-like chemotaxis protein